MDMESRIPAGNRIIGASAGLMRRRNFSTSARLAVDTREKIHRMAGTSEDVTIRMMKNVLSWFGHVERMSDERMVKKIYDGKVSGKRNRGRPRLTFEYTISKILEEGHV